MWSITILASLLLGAPATQAAPTLRRLEKRHSDCWGSNVQGCDYSTAGYSGAAVSVSLLWQLRGISDPHRKSGHARLSVSTSWPKEVMLLTVSLGLSIRRDRAQLYSDDCFFALRWYHQCVSLRYRRGQ